VYDSSTGLTTTGDIWVFTTEPSPILINQPRPPDYIPDLIYGYDDIDGWDWYGLDEIDFAFAGGGRYKQQLVVVGHNKIYFGDFE
jgi:hypothetical protein